MNRMAALVGTVPGSDAAILQENVKKYKEESARVDNVLLSYHFR